MRKLFISYTISENGYIFILIIFQAKIIIKSIKKTKFKVRSISLLSSLHNITKSIETISACRIEYII